MGSVWVPDRSFGLKQFAEQTDPQNRNPLKAHVQNKQQQHIWNFSEMTQNYHNDAPSICWTWFHDNILPFYNTQLIIN